MFTSHAIAWAYGLFEGEGSVICLGARSGPQANQKGWQASLVSTDSDVVFRFHKIVGVGHVYGPYKKARATPGRPYKDYWRWAVSDRNGLLHVYALFRHGLCSRRLATFREAAASVVKIKSRLRSGNLSSSPFNP